MNEENHKKPQSGQLAYIHTYIYSRARARARARVCVCVCVCVCVRERERERERETDRQTKSKGSVTAPTGCLFFTIPSLKRNCEMHKMILFPFLSSTCTM